MGYELRNYSLSELSRVSVPGTVTPALFWAIPVGRWGCDLSELKHWFTERDTLCHKYGLLLYHTDAPRQDDVGDVDLAKLEGSLQDLMPSGIEGFVRSSAFRRDEKKLLILSAGYPQPGWGVLLNFPGVEHFEEILSKVIDGVIGPSQPHGLPAFDDARQLFHALSAVRRAEPTFDDLPKTLSREIDRRETALAEMQQMMPCI